MGQNRVKFDRQDQVILGEMSLGTPKFQGKRPRNRGNFFTKKGSMVGRQREERRKKTTKTGKTNGGQVRRRVARHGQAR